MSVLQRPKCPFCDEIPERKPDLAVHIKDYHKDKSEGSGLTAGVFAIRQARYAYDQFAIFEDIHAAFPHISVVEAQQIYQMFLNKEQAQ